ncbi:FadR/GntR family transcriptional regulator [Oceanobacillus oncorhynchi]|uniref:FadR/GntR family transcriptional regulator n=1 Tax=Oceanobacillus oncorhynchi TaxID=545501 RepID=UPI0025A32AC6|nr:FadR/GntR family transcriptional regulator [Oceanobacillus oncorhynchi]MDM8101284.1 FadR/GntR family transcriptional regulator [Oceanobacillus oncorhynchi]
MEPINASERKSLKQTIIQEIKQYIIDNNLKAGDRLPAERKFMEIFGVSRSVIREALSYLENTGVTRVRQGQGAILNESNIDKLLNSFFFLWQVNGGDLKDIQSLRVIFESSAMEEIIKIENNNNLLKLKESVINNREAVTREAFIVADMNFHKQLLEATNNVLFIQMTNMITSYFFESASRIDITHQEFQKINDEHEKMVDMLINKDVEGAKSLLTAHINNTKKV